MTEDLIRRLEFSDARWLSESVVAAGGDVRRIGPGVAAFVGNENVLTQAVGIGIEGDFAWEELAAHYRGRCERFEFKLSPIASPLVQEAIVRRAIGISDFESILIRSTENSPSSSEEVAVEELLPEETESFVLRSVGWFYGEASPPGFVDTIVASLRVPGSRTFVVRDGLEIVGGASLRLSEGIGWLHGGAVAPEYRNRGYHRALIARRLQEAKRMGIALVAQGASPGTVSQQNAQRNGFLVAYTRPSFWVTAD